MRITFYLAAAVVIVFILQSFVPGVTEEFALAFGDATSRPWTLLTSIFLHGDVSHLLSNLFALGFFGFVLESVIGSRRFAAVFVASGLIASSFSSLAYASSLGASGAIFGIIGALAVIRPRMTAFALGVPMPMVAAATIWAFLDFAGLFYPTNVANLAHLAGLAAGLAIGMVLRKEFRERAERKERPLSKKDVDRWENRYMRVDIGLHCQEICTNSSASFSFREGNRTLWAQRATTYL